MRTRPPRPGRTSGRSSGPSHSPGRFAGDAAAKPGRTRLAPLPEGAAAERILLVGCGKKEKFDARALRRAVAAAAKALSGTGARDAVSFLAHGPVDGDHRGPGHRKVGAVSKYSCL